VIVGQSRNEKKKHDFLARIISNQNKEFTTGATVRLSFSGLARGARGLRNRKRPWWDVLNLLDEIESEKRGHAPCVSFGRCFGERPWLRGRRRHGIRGRALRATKHEWMGLQFVSGGGRGGDLDRRQAARRRARPTAHSVIGT
jgi:hypothetical protein